MYKGINKWSPNSIGNLLPCLRGFNPSRLDIDLKCVVVNHGSFCTP